MADFSVVMEKLQGFETADDIAEFFKGYGIRAQPRDAKACAITQFIKEETGCPHITTSYKSVTVYRDDDWSYKGDDSTTVSHTEAMETFVSLFDRFEYPFLHSGKK